MSVDERMRTALASQAETFVPPIELALERVRTRGRHQQWRTAAIGALAAAAAVTAGVVGVALYDASPRTPGTVGPPSVDPTAPALRGRVTAEVSEPRSLAGTWLLAFEGNGTITVTPPPELADAPSGGLFTADQTSFRTTLFGQTICAGDGTGVYTWRKTAGGIEFQVAADSCAMRRTFLTGSTWTLSTGPGARG